MPFLRFLAMGAYNVALTLSWPWAWLFYILKGRTSGRYAETFRERLGLKAPPSRLDARPLWIHALSVGETLSVVPLVRHIKETHPHLPIVFSTATESGARLARERLAPWVHTFFTMPHDFPWAMKRLIREVRPSLFLLVETDLWPNLLLGLKRKGIPAVLVNARLSPRSFQRYLRLSFLLTPLFRSLSLVFAQSAEDAARYTALGIPPDRVAAAGNLKIDASLMPLPPAERESLREEIGVEEDRPVWIAGSTHDGEEPLLLEVHKALRRRRPELLLILAPRKTGRAADLLSLCRRSGLPAVLRSSRQPAVGQAVFILDTLGELKRFYALAHIAFIGGSLVPFGGHNLLEATSQGVPAFWGPHAWNFRDMEAELQAARCGFRVSEVKELMDGIAAFLEDSAALSDRREALHRFHATRTGISPGIVKRLEESFPDFFRPGKGSLCSEVGATGANRIKCEDT